MTLRSMHVSSPHAVPVKRPMACRACIPHAVFMQREEQRVLAKAERHKLIASVVTRKRVGTQQELVDALAAAGCRVTQATASRDIRELGLEKMRDQFGVRYVVPGRERRV